MHSPLETLLGEFLLQVSIGRYFGAPNRSSAVAYCVDLMYHPPLSLARLRAPRMPSLTQENHSIDKVEKYLEDRDVNVVTSNAITHWACATREILARVIGGLDLDAGRPLRVENVVSLYKIRAMICQALFEVPRGRVSITALLR